VDGKEDRTTYEMTNRKFRELEATLRQQQIAVDRLLGSDGSTRDEPPKRVLRALQQTLFLQCPQRGGTAGRFRCVNKTGKPAYVDIRARKCPGAETSLPDEAIVVFEPNGKRLEPQEAAIFRAIVDLSHCQNAAAETLETFADVYLSDELTLKLFICVEVYDDQS
jgi:hypothetical protein